MKEQFIWPEKHRPKSFDEYVFKNERQKKLFNGWIEDKNIPHILLYGPQGSGKSTAAQLLINELGIDKGDVLYVNAAEERRIEMVREKILPFAQTVPFSAFKIVLLEEADGLAPTVQPTLKRVTEDYSANCRFILTTNHPNKIDVALKSRLVEVHCNSLDIEEFQLRAAEVLVAEGIEFDVEDLDSYIKAAYPDLRKTLNLLHEGSVDGKLQSPTDDTGTAMYQVKAVELFKQGKIRKGRDLICSNITDNEYDNFYRFCYMNQELWGKAEAQQDKALHAIRKGLVDHAFSADPEICLSDTLTYLAEIYDG